MLTTRLQSGCLGCSLRTEAGERVTLHYLEAWADEDHLKRQVRSDRFTALSGLVEGATSLPRIEFALSDGKRGLDSASEGRGAS
jgi:quinol monooxygenase YgiN